MILFENVVQVLYRSVSTAVAQCPHNRPTNFARPSGST
jgi:hypothetical protein